MSYIIAEIGINHNGDVNLAHKLIDIAKDAGCDAVKFQKRTVDVVYSVEELAMPRVSPYGTTNRDLKYGLELSIDEYTHLRQHCLDSNIDFIVSCWDKASVDLMESLKPNKYKIASACLTDLELLLYTGQYRRPIILSTGMSTKKEITEAISLLRNFNMQGILHCTSTYPTALEELNLNTIRNLFNDFTGSIGFSSHSDSIIPAAIACSMGADILEVHITDDRNRWGSDQVVSIEPKELAELCKYCSGSNMHTILGNGVKQVYKNEIPIMMKLRKEAKI